jgi:hypothetical protein
MSRLALVVALLSAASFWPAAAHAHVQQGGTASPLTAARSGTRSGTHGQRPEMCSQSSVLLSTQVVTRAVSAPVPSPVDDDDVPWCVTQNDPRCSPIQQGSLPSQVSVQAKLSSVAPLVVPLPRARELLAEPLPSQPGQARTGGRSRLERPPRSGR